VLPGPYCRFGRRARLGSRRRGCGRRRGKSLRGRLADDPHEGARRSPLRPQPAVALLLLPLAEAGITKEQLRLLARSIGVDGWDRPASACLASRIPFGEAITAGRLRRVEAAELALRTLGFRQVRVRDFGSHARVEVEADDLMSLQGQSDDVRARLVKLGFESWSSAAYIGTGAGDSPNARG
jgi:PP-loop superfamily ATP-utilizing enzyme